MVLGALHGVRVNHGEHPGAVVVADESGHLRL